MRVTIVGSGNVAEIFANALRMELVEICARNETRGQALANAAGCHWVREPEEVAPADLYLIAVKDSAIEEVSSRLAVCEGSVVAHMAGGVPLDALRSRTLHRGVLYPFQTFTAGRQIALDLVPLLVETATDHARRTLMKLAESLSGTVMEIDSTQRVAIHAAGAISCNFTNHLLHLSAQLLRNEGIPFTILEPLMNETVRKAFSVADPAEVQTGPAVRHDTATISKHLELLAKQNENYSKIYKTISDSIIWETSKKI